MNILLCFVFFVLGYLSSKIKLFDKKPKRCAEYWEGKALDTFTADKLGNVTRFVGAQYDDGIKNGRSYSAFGYPESLHYSSGIFFYVVRQEFSTKRFIVIKEQESLEESMAIRFDPSVILMVKDQYFKPEEEVIK